MSRQSSLNELAHARFRDAFGAPDRVQGGGEQWSIHTCHNGHTINIMLNGCAEGPAVWVFDPNDSLHGVHNASLKSEAAVDQFVAETRERITRAIERHAEHRTGLPADRTSDLRAR